MKGSEFHCILFLTNCTFLLVKYAVKITNMQLKIKMKKYDLEVSAKSLFVPNIINMISLIHEYKGKQSLYIESNKDALTNLLNIAKIQSAEYSNKIEGIQTSDKRIKEIINDKVTPRNRNEEEIAGYRDALEVIHENYENISISPNYILQLHKILYRYSTSSIGGKFKTTDNYIQEIDELGNKSIRFKPVSAVETPFAIEKLCETYNEEIEKMKIDPLLLIPIFILDFLSIHPFSDGNGRMSRLLTLLLLYQNGYIVGKYISIEKIVENSKESYYDTLKKSSENWHENKNNYIYFTEYYLGTILLAYKDFCNRVDYITNKKMSAKDRILLIIQKSVAKVSKKQIIEMCPDISPSTIEKALNNLLNDDLIIKIGNGRYTSYYRK